MPQLLQKKQTRHGYHGTSVYGVWAGMVKRCETPSSSNYKYYGGRGIKVCEEWRMNPKAFCDWALNNGYKKGLRIDRKDTEGDYTPENCHFITHAENCAAGKRRVKSDNKTGHSGISMSKHGRFEVYLQVDGKQKYIGVRKTLPEAIKLKKDHERN